MPPRLVGLLIVGLSTAALAGCGSSARSVDLGPLPVEGSFRFEGEPALGEIRVVPVLTAFEQPSLRTDGYVTDVVVDARLSAREHRMDEVAHIPDALADALPGAIHAQIDHAWTGHFTVGHLAHTQRGRLESALGRGDRALLDEILADAAESVGGQATLFTWITELAADPLTAEGFPGDRVDTVQGPVFLDMYEEPYRVRAEIGMALVRADGQVVLRYADRGEALLTDHRDASRVGRDLARGLAAEVALMWPDDPRLWRRPDRAARTQLAETKVVPPSADVPTSTPEVPFHGLRKAARPTAVLSEPR